MFTALRPCPVIKSFPEACIDANVFQPTPPLCDTHQTCFVKRDYTSLDFGGQVIVLWSSVYVTAGGHTVSTGKL